MKRIIFIGSLIISIFTANAQVIVTSAGNVDMCVGGSYKTIPDFKVAEKANADFKASSSLQIYKLGAPNNFEFNPGVGFVKIPSSTDIAFAYLNVTSDTITLNYFLNTTAQKDSFIFKNIQVRAVGNNSSNDLRLTSGNAYQNQINNNLNQYAHAHFNSNQAYVNLNASQKVVCTNASDITLNGSPGSGSYSVSPSSSGLAGSTFKPTVSGSGSFVITYTANQNGCTGIDTVHITVKPVPSVTFFGLSSSYCSSDTINVQLVGFPNGGTFTGSGTSGSNGSVFKPYTISTGTNIPIKYTYSDPNGCQNSSQITTNVLESPSVSIVLNPNNSSCSINDPGILITGTQSHPTTGGTITLSGDGVNNSTGYFIPSAAGLGDHTIYRTLKAPNGCTATAPRKINVNNSISNYIIGLDDKYCIYDSPVTLTSSFFGATFSGPGIDPSNPTIFDPSKVPDFPGQQFTFDISVSILGLPTGFTKPTTVYKKPIIIISQDTARNSINFRTKFCSQDPAVPLNVYIYPPGGVGSFSGPGLDGVKFNPSLVVIDVNKFIDTINLTYSYTDANGCQNVDKDTVQIFSVTTGLDFGTLAPRYCSNSDTVTLNATKDGVYFPGGAFNGNGMKGNKFIPSLAASYNNGLSDTHEIKYIYGNASGCQTIVSKNVIINKRPDVYLNGLNPAYCLSKDSIVLNGTPSSNGGIYTAFTSLPKVLEQGVLANKKFYIGKTTPGKYTIIYSYTDPSTNCSSADSVEVTINDLPEVYFSGLKESYCFGDSETKLTAFPPNSTGTGFTSSPVSGVVAGDIFLPSLAGVNTHKITYTYTDKNGCKNDSTISTVVYGKPNPNFKMSSFCENDTILFRDSLSTLASIPEASSSIIKWIWNVGTQTFTKKNLDLSLRAGSYSISYITTTDAGCSDTVSKPVIIGSYPQTKFTWDEICNNTETKFQNTTPALTVGSLKSVVWNFSDPDSPYNSAIDSIIITNTVNGNTIHTYKTPKTYKVFLKAYSDKNCIAIDTHNVFILESRIISKTQPYSNDFNDLLSDWVESSAVDSISSSWKIGVPSKTHIHSGNGAWVTSLTKNFTPDEQSYVYSPCFTFDNSITKPMIHMDVWSWTILNSSGANLQYSRNGREWNTLGKRNGSGVNWYNNTGNIASRPAGSQLDQDGWTDTIPGWKNARHVFDNELGSSKNIRFRVSFAGNKDISEGFAFDNVWIGERSRLILTEHFTNNASLFTRSENEWINKLINENSQNGEPKDIIQLQYHTAFPGFDPMNQRNIPDPGARALYYGVTQVPYSCVDGSYFNGSAFRIDTNMIDTRALYDPAFEFELKPVVTETTVSGSIDITNKLPVKNNVTVYISLLERYVNKIPGNSGESTYEWVHAKFLPNAAGTSFLADWSAQPTKTINIGWPIPAGYFYDNKKLAMVAFVQDNVTKEIYQAAYKGIGATVTTAVFEPNDVASTVTLYPNPANDATTVVLNGKLKGNYNWVIFDELGRIADQGLLQDGTEGFTINTQSYASGFYTLRLSNNSDGVKTQKFVVVH